MVLDPIYLYDRMTRAALRASGFKSRHVRTSVGSVHALMADGDGSGPPVAVLHGFSAHATQYGALLRRLRRVARRVVAPDLPGHGFSDTPRAGLTPETLGRGMVEALDHLVDDGSVLFGSSMGGLQAVRYALQRPAKLRGLVLASPAGAPMDDAEAHELRELLRVRTHDDALRFVDRLFHRSPRIRHVMAQGVRIQLGRPHLQGLLDAVKPHHFLRPAEVRALAPPTLVIFGAADRLLPRSARDFFRAHLPAHSRMDEPAEFGHVPFLDHTD